MEFYMKKNTKRFELKLLIIALAVIIGFSMCSDDKGGNGPTFFGNKMDLDGEVFWELWKDGENEWDNSVSYPTRFNVDLAIKNTYGGSGNISGGNLSYSIEVPTDLITLNFKELFSEIEYSNFKPGVEVKGVVLNFLPVNGYAGLYRGENTIAKLAAGNFIITYRQVIYIYVDGDVTVSGKGWHDDLLPETTAGGITITTDYHLRDLLLELKAGWNTVYFEVEKKGNITETSVRIEETVTVSQDNPDDLIWYISTPIP
jgi:hypothetical protein